MFTIIVTVHKGEDSYTIQAKGKNSRKVTREVDAALNEMFPHLTIVRMQSDRKEEHNGRL